MRIVVCILALFAASLCEVSATLISSDPSRALVLLPGAVERVCLFWSATLLMLVTSGVTVWKASSALSYVVAALWLLSSVVLEVVRAAIGGAAVAIYWVVLCACIGIAMWRMGRWLSRRERP